MKHPFYSVSIDDIPFGDRIIAILLRTYLVRCEDAEQKLAAILSEGIVLKLSSPLAGYEDMVGEEAREVGSFQELTESEMEVLNQKISLIADVLEKGHHPVLKFTYFIADIAKVGGSYVTMTERVRKIDAVGRKIQLFKTVGASKRYMELDMDKISDISGDLMDSMR